MSPPPRRKRVTLDQLETVELGQPELATPRTDDADGASSGGAPRSPSGAYVVPEGVSPEVAALLGETTPDPTPAEDPAPELPAAAADAPAAQPDSTPETGSDAGGSPPRASEARPAAAGGARARIAAAGAAALLLAGAAALLGGEAPALDTTDHAQRAAQLSQPATRAVTVGFRSIPEPVEPVEAPASRATPCAGPGCGRATRRVVAPRITASDVF